MVCLASLSPSLLRALKAFLFSGTFQPCPVTVLPLYPSSSLPGHNSQWALDGQFWSQGLCCGTASILGHFLLPAQSGCTCTGSQQKDCRCLQMIHKSMTFLCCSMGTHYKAPSVFPFGNLRAQVSCTMLKSPSGICEEVNLMVPS